MTNMNKKAIVIGATGLVGKALVKQLQAASEFESVTVVVRKELDEFKVFSKVSQFVLKIFCYSMMKMSVAIHMLLVVWDHH
jgi:NAD dependent epimerase/dehydratase family enzyme